MKKWILLGCVISVLALVIASIATLVEAATYTYNRQSAANYALANWNKDVPGSSYFGANDCTNFVSNCLKTGGWPETYKPSTYTQHLSYKTYPYAWYADFSMGWYSYTWGGANNFGQFVSIYSNRGTAYSLAHTPWYQYFQIGDIVQIDYDKDGIWDHTMIITSVTSNDMSVTYHWAPSSKVSLTQLMKDKYPNARFMGYRLYNQFSQ